MNWKPAVLGMVAAFVVAGTAQAQDRPKPGTEEFRQAMEARREALQGKREAMMQRRELMRQRWANATPEQRAFFEALRTERQSLRDQVKAGTLDRAAARQALRDWIQANRPQKPQN